MRQLHTLNPLRALKPRGALAGAALILSACISPVATSTGNYAAPIGNASVTANPTAYSQGLVCMGHYARQSGIRAPRIAVGRIIDYTGKGNLTEGRQITQGGSLMAMSALAKAGALLVERFDTSVAELDLKYKNNQLIGEQVGQSDAILRGAIPGSDFYLVGGITELNAAIREFGGDIRGTDLDPTDGTATARANLYVINVGLDLRLVRTSSLEVFDVISYQKQIIGREISLGLFEFANGNVFDIGTGERAQEPIQLAVRAVIERAALEIMANLYGAPSADVCPLTEGIISTNGLTGDFRPGRSPIDRYNGTTRQAPNQ